MSADRTGEPLFRGPAEWGNAAVHHPPRPQRGAMPVPAIGHSWAGFLGVEGNLAQRRGPVRRRHRSQMAAIQPIERTPHGPSLSSERVRNHRRKPASFPTAARGAHKTAGGQSTLALSFHLARGRKPGSRSSRCDPTRGTAHGHPRRPDRCRKSSFDRVVPGLRVASYLSLPVLRR